VTGLVKATARKRSCEERPLAPTPGSCPCPALPADQIGVNEVAITAEVAPFGGIKQSGLGREQGT
jgi:hypothetical protein